MKHTRHEKKHSRQQVFDFIVSFKRENDGLSPTVREIMESCNIPSSSNTTYILDELSRNGLIALNEGKRGIMFIGSQWVFPAPKLSEVGNAIR
ncbi:MAG: hypothetical protein CVU46_09595 [Chloroflexi bacterium HGW-Chloroflexi-8]|nr:MAG: hypothetical protein CVU46_09595 [Chloroflexi bacterium HGW-Chloroflexi-8]